MALICDVRAETRATHRAANEREYGEDYGRLRWLDGRSATEAEGRRLEAIDALGQGVEWACDGTKPHYGPLSPGCARCVAGTWSCLFVNGVCNARCFFCPTRQHERGEPTTGQLEFTDPGDYVDYLERFGFDGASLSGGEPFLTLERTVTFLRAIRERFGSGVYLWLYTNGMLATDEALQAVADAGLDEIRFNLHANDYRLEPVASAATRIPTVTIETPAVPEDEARMRDLLPVLADLGVAHVNLHDVRVTPHNVQHVVERGYTCLHGPKVRVLESELTALRLLGEASRQQLALAVQYCCFPYKNPYQTRASRRRWAPFVMRAPETLTDTGAIRRCAVSGEPAYISSLVELWERQGRAPIGWVREGRKGRSLLVVPELLKDVDFEQAQVRVSYASATTVGSPSYRFLPVRVELNDRRQLIVERRALGDSWRLEGEQLAEFLALAEMGHVAPRTGALPEAESSESLAQGLPEYY
jgi:pyruvate formate-lyase activating enzyme-like uncharacterized protein